MTSQTYHSGARATLSTPQGDRAYYSLPYLEKEGLTNLDRLPYTIRILLENGLRSMDGYLVEEEDIAAVASWRPQRPRSERSPSCWLGCSCRT